MPGVGRADGDVFRLRLDDAGAGERVFVRPVGRRGIVNHSAPSAYRLGALRRTYSDCEHQPRGGDYGQGVADERGDHRISAVRRGAGGARAALARR